MINDRCECLNQDFKRKAWSLWVDEKRSVKRKRDIWKFQFITTHWEYYKDFLSSLQQFSDDRLENVPNDENENYSMISNTSLRKNSCWFVGVGNSDFNFVATQNPCVNQFSFKTIVQGQVQNGTIFQNQCHHYNTLNQHRFDCNSIIYSLSSKHWLTHTTISFLSISTIYV